MNLGSATYRLRFLGPSTERGAPVLAEATVRAANIEGAIRSADDAEWPPGAHALPWSIWTAKRSTNGSRPIVAELIAAAIATWRRSR